MEKSSQYLFLGGSHHGEWRSVPSSMDWVVLLMTPEESQKIFDKAGYDTTPSVTADQEGYAKRTVALPAGAMTVFIADKSLPYFDDLLTDYVKEQMDVRSPEDQKKQNSLGLAFDLAVDYTPGPMLAVPGPTPEEGLTIVIGDRVLHWDANAQQLSGILSWAVQSLGPASEK